VRRTTPRGTHRSDSRRRVDGRGQSLLEFALAIPIFLAIFFGAIDMGLLFKTRAAYEEATQQAVRIGAAAGSNLNADQDILTQLQRTVPVENLQTVVVTIYKADDPAYVPPPLSDLSNDGKHTNYIFYNGAFVCAAHHEAAGTMCTGQSYWDPASRITGIGATLDHIGVRITYSYKSLTGAFTIPSISETATSVLEPTSY